MDAEVIVMDELEVIEDAAAAERIGGSDPH